jgi:pimeloyl-ACP methyl ester carboxylesterase
MKPLIMLFLHGMLSAYDRPPEQIEAAAHRYAAATGYVLEVLPATGDDRVMQENNARRRIQSGEIVAVYGFSMGGYTAERIQRDYPNIKYIKVGAPGTSGDIDLPVDHMDMPMALAKQSPRALTRSLFRDPCWLGHIRRAPRPAWRGGSFRFRCSAWFPEPCYETVRRPAWPRVNEVSRQ